jgi:hypothetical protein
MEKAGGMEMSVEENDDAVWNWGDIHGFKSPAEMLNRSIISD